MPETTRARFVVNDLLERKDKDGNTMGIIVKMNPSYENGVIRAFWQATPTGSLEMQDQQSSRVRILPARQQVLARLHEG